MALSECEGAVGFLGGVEMSDMAMHLKSCIAAAARADARGDAALAAMFRRDALLLAVAMLGI